MFELQRLKGVHGGIRQRNGGVRLAPFEMENGFNVLRRGEREFRTLQAF